MSVKTENVTKISRSRVTCHYMFQLSIIKDTLSVHPAQFGVPPDEALIAEINKKYANRVLHDLGLCVCLFDLVQAGEGKVRYGDGCLWYKGAFVCVSLRYMR